ncbi:MAG: hypothetical protein HYU58_03465 [Proteobacteria bacterium]|nr:hypothetical protein [Pseudomonadota bacterium]
MRPYPEDMNRHDPAEDWSRPQPVGWLSRSPVTIVTHGCPTTQDDHLIGLQSIVGRCVRILLDFDFPHLRMPRLHGPASLLRQLF